MKNVLAIIGIFLLARNLGNTAITAVTNAIDVGRTAYRDWQLSASGLSFTMLIDVVNNNPATIPLTRINGNIIFSGLAIGSFVENNPVLLEPSETKTLEFQIDIPFAQLAGNVVGLIQSGSINPNLKLKGFVYSDGVSVGVPFEKNLIRIG